MIYQTDIIDLKTNIQDIIGQKIKIKGTSGRSKFFEKEATIEKIYQNIFAVKYDGHDRNTTYTYTDVLTKNVELQIYDGENYNTLLTREDLSAKKVI